MLCFDAQLKLISTCCIAEGTPGEVSVAPRVVLREAMRRDALGAVVCHNHPSGSPFPSEEDISLEDSFKEYQEGMKLLKYCHEAISEVEKKVQKIAEDGTLEDFE